MHIFTLLYIQGTQGLEILDSLRCVNNFKTHWTCHWNEMEKVREILPMSLYRWNKLNSTAPSSNQEDGKLHMSCRFDDRFSSSVAASFAFVTEKDVHVETCLIPTSKVQMFPPEDLELQMSDNGKMSLSWRMPKLVHSSASLLYQVIYCRKDWETWEDAVSLNVLGKMEVHFSPQSFVPGSTYLFRVRSVRHEDPGYRSAWSKELTWATPSDHGTIIQNLKCEYDGSVKMNCSWEVKRELISSVSFTLYYTESPTDCKFASTDGKKSCLGEIDESKESGPYVQYRCSLQVPLSQAHNYFSIQVRMLEEVKDLKAHENIQIESPTDLQIKNQSSNGYTLIWSPPEVVFPTIQLTYQLCYWKEGDPECPPYSLVNVSGNPPEYYFPISKLEGFTHYTAKVRAKPDEKSLYNGPWSEWSQSRSWRTTNVLTTNIICICAFIISITISLFAFFAFRYYKRLKQSFNDSLPNPSKSKLLRNQPLGYWKQSYYPFIHRDFYAEEKPSICVTVSPVALQSTYESAEELVTENTPNPDANPLGPYSLPPPAEEKIMPDQCKSLGTGEKSDTTTVSTSEVKKGLSNKSYNGPYLMFSGGKSMSNLVSNEAKHPGYFSLPSCQAEIFNLPKETTQICQPQPPGDQMGYVISMEKPLSVQPMQNQDKKCAPDNKYTAIPASSDFQVLPEGPLMIINPDGSGPLLLKQVGDYCFFPGLRGSQEHLERKMAPVSEQNQQNAPEDPPLPAVQAFKVMQRGYLALPHT
ncbi:PREDICTED: cytokine receptor common subunit beta [Nanorana parkeri]|uniref:cytokine receptor common subunit beta n=1 Tax=Nanorana parkeri TaxID=125878 RepID=UPI0008542720|nr:PREDICTED: cytokine receptor common subunit beta [Nanorana parkeri]